jgi:hypothetical protein
MYCAIGAAWVMDPDSNKDCLVDHEWLDAFDGRLVGQVISWSDGFGLSFRAIADMVEAWYPLPESE